MRVIVTGGFGYIGSRLVDALRALGHEAEVYDLKNDPCDDVLDFSRVEAAVRASKVVYHLASLSIVYDSRTYL